MTTLRVGPTAPLRGACRVPGDKSISHRAAILSALAHGTSFVRGFSDAQDVARTVEAMRRMGVAARVEGDTLEVTGAGLDSLGAAGALDCGNSGTSLRLLTGLCAAQRTTTLLDGDASLRRRPMRRLVEPLERMGARIEGRPASEASVREDIVAPLRVHGGPLRGIEYETPLPSAQLKSALLLAALWADSATRLREPARSRDHTERLLRLQRAPLGVSDAIVVDPRGWNRRLQPLDISVPGDLSAATFIVVAALLAPGSELVVRDVGLNPTRTGALDVLRAMGARIELRDVRDLDGEPRGDLAVWASRLRGCVIAGELALRALDEIPLLAVAASQAVGTTVIRDAAELRHKESDRLATIARALRRLGCEVAEAPDGLVIEGPCALRGAVFVADDVARDHRIAMSVAVAGLVASDGVEVEGAEVIATSFPSFAQTLEQLGATVSQNTTPKLM